MREPTFLILTALADGPRHGYGVIKDVSELSAGRITLLAGTLYTALDRLTAEGLVEPDHEERVDGRLRRYYRLTDTGRTALAERAAELQRAARIARTRLRANPGTA
ncbi:PadR family transcriptional regulator [Actinocatenispora rupis]|nr:PadR family transcriptional regulator [Actinocatenispora rupis]